MKSREFDARRLDVRAFAQAGGQLQGQWPLAGFERLAQALAGEPGATDVVAWSLQGRQVPVKGGKPELWLHLRADARVALVCQRCLQPSEHGLSVDREFQFVEGEDEAARLDGEVEHDVLALGRDADVHVLLEDELLLELPLVPRHAECPAPLPLPADGMAEDDAAAHPFAALATLRQRRPS